MLMLVVVRWVRDGECVVEEGGEKGDLVNSQQYITADGNILRTL